MSRFRLTPDSRHLPPRHIFIVRQKKTMDDASAELDAKLAQAYAHIEPKRMYMGAKVSTSPAGVIVRIYSQKKDGGRLLPPPYAIYRYDAVSSRLTQASEEENRAFRIQNYK
jgi:hypothetical protein